MPSFIAGLFVACVSALLCLASAQAADTRALVGALPPASGGICRAAIATAEAALRVPDAFLSAIAKVESGRADPETGIVTAWPWAVNAEGIGSFYASKAEAIAAVRALQARGVRSIDVGCLQVNLLQHPDAFASLEEAFDPVTNANYAAGFLSALFRQTGSWPLAAAAYHSQTPTLGAPYERRVLAEWATPDSMAAASHPRIHTAKPPAPHNDPATQEAEAPAASVAQGMVASGPIGRAPVMGATVFPGAHGGGPVGRSLAAYRQVPIRLAMRAPGS